MAHEHEGDLLGSGGVQAVVTGILHGGLGHGLGNHFLVGVDHGGVRADLAQQGLSHGNALELVAVGVDHLHHLVVLGTVHQMGGLHDQVLHAVGHSTVHGLLHVVDLLAVTGLHMVDDDLCGKGAAHAPVRVGGLQGVLDALDVLHTAVVEGGAKGDHQQLVLADVVLVAGGILGSIAGVTAKIIGVSIFAFHQLLLSVGQGVPGSLGSSTLLVGVVVALLDIDGIDQVCHVLCGSLVGVLAGCFAAGSGRRTCCAGSGAGCGAAAAAEHTGAQSQGSQGGSSLADVAFSHDEFLSFLFVQNSLHTPEHGAERAFSANKKGLSACGMATQKDP